MGCVHSHDSTIVEQYTTCQVAIALKWQIRQVFCEANFVVYIYIQELSDSIELSYETECSETECFVSYTNKKKETKTTLATYNTRSF